MAYLNCANYGLKLFWTGALTLLTHDTKFSLLAQALTSFTAVLCGNVKAPLDSLSEHSKSDWLKSQGIASCCVGVIVAACCANCREMLVPWYVTA